MSSTVDAFYESAPSLSHRERPMAGLEAAVEPSLSIIEHRRGWQFVDLGELWRYRELLFFLTWRDVKVRYKQTVLGAAWAIVQPLATMLVFGLFFNRMASGSASALPYPLFVLAGLVPWMFFSGAICSAAQSVVASQNLVTKIYFPRLIIPMGAVGAALVDFVISFGVLLAMIVFRGELPGWGILALPLLSLGLIAAALGMGALLAALTVTYRDFRYVIPFTIQLWMFATPSIYLQAGSTPGLRGRILLSLNPAYGLIANFRHALTGEALDLCALVISGAISLILLWGGCLYYRGAERKFSDII